MSKELADYTEEDLQKSQEWIEAAPIGRLGLAYPETAKALAALIAEARREGAQTMYYGDPAGTVVRAAVRSERKACERIVEEVREWIVASGMPQPMRGYKLAALDNVLRRLRERAGAAAREQPTQDPHAFEPCREGDEGDDPAHNFTCALLCIHCGLPRERHQPTQEKPEAERA